MDRPAVAKRAQPRCRAGRVAFDAKVGNYYIATHDLLASEVTVAGQPAAAGQVPLIGTPTGL